VRSRINKKRLPHCHLGAVLNSKTTRQSLQRAANKKRLPHCHLGAVLNSKTTRRSLQRAAAKAATEVHSFIKAAGAFIAAYMIYMMSVTAWLN
jgi:hypothetical protein